MITVRHTRTARQAGAITITVAAAALGLAALVSLVAAALAVHVARQVVTPPRRKEEDLAILGATENTVVLSSMPDSRTPGRYSLWFSGDTGHARVGGVIEQDATTVTRELLTVDFGDIASAGRGRFNGWYYLSPREFDYPYDDVEIATTLGMAPAWFIPAANDSDAWVIQVHGRAVTRSEGLRAVPVFRDAGYHSLLISFRNDGDAPQSTDHRYGLGDTEWQDVESAIRYAVKQGARAVVLMGWSMGGATALQAATRSAFGSIIRGIVLDSPVIDWADVVDYQAALSRVPRPIRRAALAVISSGWGGILTGQARPIDLARLDFVARAGELRWPILLMHSDDDGYVPSTSSRLLAEVRADIVTYVPFSVARHTKLWNYDPTRWNSTIAAWLSERTPQESSARRRRSSRRPSAAAG